MPRRMMRCGTSVWAGLAPRSERGLVLRTCAAKGQRDGGSLSLEKSKLLLRCGSIARSGSSCSGAMSTGAPLQICQLREHVRTDVEGRRHTALPSTEHSGTEQLFTQIFRRRGIVDCYGVGRDECVELRHALCKHPEAEKRSIFGPLGTRGCCISITSEENDTLRDGVLAWQRGVEPGYSRVRNAICKTETMEKERQ